ncbi:MAG: hypothetical protein SGI99_10340 [Pseudomonadota bacterium]|nr:hypothetical protein [Pseudomonadota bacterium]
MHSGLDLQVNLRRAVFALHWMCAGTMALLPAATFAYPLTRISHVESPLILGAQGNGSASDCASPTMAG